MKIVQKPQKLDEKNTKKKYTDYAHLFQKLDGILLKEDLMYKIDMDDVPYEIPAICSLKVEMKKLTSRQRRLGILREYFYRTESEAVSLDWEHVGGDLSHAISEYGRKCVGKNR